MKKTLLFVSFGLVLPPLAVQAEGGAYIGLGYGEAQYDTNVNVNTLVNQTYAEMPLRAIDEGQPVREGNRITKSDDTDTAWKMYGGYKFNRYIAVEASYADLGEIGGSVLVDGLEGISQVSGTEGVWRGGQRTDVSANAQVFTLSARGSLPLGDWFELFAKMGAAYYETESQRAWVSSGYLTVPGESAVEANGRLTHKKKSSSDYTWLYGVGAGLNLGEHWGVNLEYESYQDIEFGGYLGDKVLSKDNINMWSLSVDYSF